MPRTPAQNKRIKDKRRQKLLDAALIAFATNGFDGVAIDDITKQAKCSHGLFYHYFGTKEEVYSEVLKTYIADANLFALGESSDEGALEAIRRFCEAYEKILKGPKISLYAAALLLSIPNQTKSKDIDDRVLGKKSVLDALQAMVRSGQESGDVVAGDPREIALAIYDLCCGSVHRVLLGKRSFSRVVSADVLCGLFLKHPL